MTHYLIDNQPDEWEQLAKIYDKDGEYKRKYLESKKADEAEDSNAANKNEENDEEAKEESKQKWYHYATPFHLEITWNLFDLVTVQ